VSMLLLSNANLCTSSRIVGLGAPGMIIVFVWNDLCVPARSCYEQMADQIEGKSLSKRGIAA
jgi:hypothetical protein